jgi:hypothetical protein
MFVKLLYVKKGFVLFYTLLIISVSLVLVLSIVNSSLNELRFSGDEFRSMTAFYAADSAIECVRSWQNITHINTPPYSAFDTRHPPASYPCGFGDSFTVGQGSSEPFCAYSEGVPSSVTYPTFRLNQFASGLNSPCADVTATVTPGPLGTCRVSFVAQGKNDCRAGAINVVERTRWENWFVN